MMMIYLRGSMLTGLDVHEKIFNQREAKQVSVRRKCFLDTLNETESFEVIEMSKKDFYNFEELCK